jgi:hypothetical protein
MSDASVSRILEREPSSHGSHVYFIILHLNFLNPNFICIRFMNLKKIMYLCIYKCVGPTI